jgi:hypothetical protein
LLRLVLVDFTAERGQPILLSHAGKCTGATLWTEGLPAAAGKMGRITRALGI